MPKTHADKDVGTRAMQEQLPRSTYHRTRVAPLPTVVLRDTGQRVIEFPKKQMLL